MGAKNNSDELHLTRVYDAPVKLVWDAWTDPKQVAKWWGPRGFTITTHSKDLRPGGIWHYTMHGPDGTDWPNKTLYHEVEKYSRLVYDHGGNDVQKPLFKVTVTFKETNGKTKMDMTMKFESPERAREIAVFIKQAGGNSTWDRLAEFLEKDTTGKDKFVINRSFNADINTVFDMWTNPEHVAKWLPPTGMTMKYLHVDIKPGGKSFFMMTNGQGLTMYGLQQYLEVTKPSRFVYTQQFADENENISRHPMAPTWPENMLTTVQFSVEDEETTRVTVTWEPWGKASAEEIATFVKERAGMTQGWTGSFDKLEEYLAKR
ncbi:SRPBCC family protein [Bdellovibrio sp. NC01]|uniref:SRPBCC family protein n=1 Tax=Bdellovibrio sp. NC01 TaxID=2220073 RepID=UPI00115AD5A8|nr:SRPBCC family protein [Bdellovibrio sp. NC01]QDK37307.1 hypothetical protein DOE51_06745 [Bdellovibrio sp. NC01]